MFRPLLALAAVSMILTACESVARSQPPKQAWICGREYQNQAWGYQRNGIAIDGFGTIWSYRVERSPNIAANRWEPKDVSRLSEAEVAQRYTGATKTGKSVTPADIARQLPLIEQAAQATPTPPKGVGADMGQTLTYCYTYDAETQLYAQVMLDNKGDWDSTNPSPQASALKSWLGSVFGD